MNCKNCGHTFEEHIKEITSVVMGEAQDWIEECKVCGCLKYEL